MEIGQNLVICNNQDMVILQSLTEKLFLLLEDPENCESQDLFPKNDFELSDTERYTINETGDFEWSSSIEAPFLDYYSG